LTVSQLRRPSSSMFREMMCVQFGFAIRMAHGMGLLWQTCNRGVLGAVTFKLGGTIGQAHFISAQALRWALCGNCWTQGPISWGLACLCLGLKPPSITWSKPTWQKGAKVNFTPGTNKSICRVCPKCRAA
jgi:hypothetical protein